MEAEAERRKTVDDKFSDIEGQLSALRFEMANNTEITKQVRDVLASFRVIASVAKWFTAVGAFGVMCWHAWQKATGR